jgi:hypothetical protein
MRAQAAAGSNQSVDSSPDRRSALAKPVPPRRDYFLRLKPPATNAIIVMTIATAATNISNSKIPMLNIVLVPLSMDAELAATSVALRDT